MTDLPTIARQRALNCEAKKHAYRQTQDGVVVSFVLHPQEVPDDLATAPLGTRYVLAMVALNDDETPKDHAGGAPGPSTLAATKNASTPESRRGEPAPVASEDSTTPARARKSWYEMAPAQQAGVLCNEPAFYSFVYTNHASGQMRALADEAETMTDSCAIIVRQLCRVDSRKNILPNTTAAVHWKTLVEDYRTWQLAAQVVPV